MGRANVDQSYAEDIRLGHLRRRPSSQRIYKSSAIGDLLFGDCGVSDGDVPFTSFGDASADDGNAPEISSRSSVTTRPFAVIILLRTMRLCGKRLCDVCMCCLTAGLLPRISEVNKRGVKRKVVDILIDTLENVKNNIIC